MIVTYQLDGGANERAWNGFKTDFGANRSSLF